MGRTVKRVPLDFDWPHHKVWKGYINPHSKPCPENGKTCFNGQNAACVYLEHLANMFGVIADSAARGETHPYCRELPYGGDHPDWKKQPKDVRKKFIDFTCKLANYTPSSPFGFTGHGHQIFFRLLEFAGIIAPGAEGDDRYEWLHCTVCKGEGLDPAAAEKYNAWKEEEPPKGKGWQLWETTTEGSPISPVFETAEKLAAWCEKNAGIFGDEKMPKEKWLQMFKKKEDLEAGSMLLMDGKGYMGSVAQAPGNE